MQANRSGEQLAALVAPLVGSGAVHDLPASSMPDDCVRFTVNKPESREQMAELGSIALVRSEAAPTASGSKQMAALGLTVGRVWDCAQPSGQQHAGGLVSSWSHWVAPLVGSGL